MRISASDIELFARIRLAFESTAGELLPGKKPNSRLVR